MVTYSSNNKEVMQFEGLNELRKKTASEIAELVKSVRENKKLNVEEDEKRNLRKLREFTESQTSCLDTCKNNLIKQFEKDLIEYTNVNNKHNLTFNEDSRKNLENHYKQLEEQFCYYICSRKYNFVFSDRT